jgi:sugar lactone lactonase YvrE
MDELYITTARNGIVGDELQKQPLAGSLFRVKPGVRGLEAYQFAG